jgi:hypothetical protein
MQKLWMENPQAFHVFTYKLSLNTRIGKRSFLCFELQGF